MVMYETISVWDVLRKKKSGYWAIAPKVMAYDALELMAEKDIGALLVMDGRKLVGIFSERDYARKVILVGKSSKTTTVEELMSSPAITASPGLTLRDCMVLMTANHIRHLPVLDNGEVAGVVSIGDVVSAIITGQEQTIHELERYIRGDDYTVTYSTPF
jgi:signal-transduction protein with cAMP-binding, CBS, and nucleotidyltransferase domain